MLPKPWMTRALFAAMQSPREWPTVFPYVNFARKEAGLKSLGVREYDGVIDIVLAFGASIINATKARGVLFLLQRLGLVHQLGELGHPTFRPTHDACLAFLNTDCTGVTATQGVRLPFPAFMIEVPRSLDLPFCGKPLAWVVVSELGMSSPERMAFLIPRGDVASMESLRAYHGDVLARWAELRNSGKLLPAMSIAAFNSDNEAHTVCTAVLGEQDFEARLIDERPEYRAIIRLAVNTILYVNSCKNQQVLSEGPRMDLAPDRKKRAWVLGRDVVLQKELRAHLTEYVRTGSPGWKLLHRHAVRGHYRELAFVPKGKTDSRIWVKPHMRGPEDFVAATVRRYTVEHLDDSGPGAEPAPGPEDIVH